LAISGQKVTEARRETNLPQKRLSLVLRRRAICGERGVSLQGEARPIWSSLSVLATGRTGPSGQRTNPPIRERKEEPEAPRSWRSVSRESDPVRPAPFATRVVGGNCALHNAPGLRAVRGTAHSLSYHVGTNSDDFMI